MSVRLSMGPLIPALSRQVASVNEANPVYTVTKKELAYKNEGFKRINQPHRVEDRVKTSLLAYVIN